ncbi:MAG: uridine kinase [PVC group bacterium]
MKKNQTKTGSLLVGIGGGSCAGKSTLAGMVRGRLSPIKTEIVTCDRYYRPLDHLPLEKRHLQNFDSLEMLDSALLAEHLSLLKAGMMAEMPVYDYRRHTRSPKPEPMTPPAVLLVEGILLFAVADLARLLDLKIYIEAEADLRLARRIRRDRVERGRSVDSVLDQYFASVRPAHEKLVAPTRGLADLVVSGEEDPEKTAGRIVNLIRPMINIQPC